jgi:hypothetical protein
MPYVWNNSKRVTIRTGHRNIAAGQNLVIENATDETDTLCVVPHTVVHTYLKHVNENHLNADGFLNAYDAAKKMQRFYPDITVDSKVTVVVW